MIPAFEADRQLFSYDHLEGEFTAWVFLWNRVFGGTDVLRGPIVDNYGTSYTDETTNVRAYILSRDNVLTTVPNYLHAPPLSSRTSEFEIGSLGRKYVLHEEFVVRRTFRVYRRGINIFSRLVTLDRATVTEIRQYAMSPDGRYIVMMVDDSVAGFNKVLMMYVGR